MTDGNYFSDRYAGSGGGIYPENHQGSYEIRVLNSDGKLLSKTAFESAEWPEANFPGKFTLLFDDYNGDGNPDFTVGQWGSSSMNLYRIYTVLPDGTVKKISGEDISHLSRDFTVKFDKDNGSGFFARIYNSATGETKAVPYSWNKQKDGFYESASASSSEPAEKTTGTSEGPAGRMTEYPFGSADYKIKVPGKDGVYNFFADVTWSDGDTETVFFRITATGRNTGAWDFHLTLRCSGPIEVTDFLILHRRVG